MTAMVAAMCAIPCQAKKISDASKQKQVSSMEYINWNFEPAIFYGWFHHNYSGAKSKFFGLDYSFHENRSNVKRLCWIRSENLGLNAAQKELMKASTATTTIKISSITGKEYSTVWNMPLNAAGANIRPLWQIISSQRKGSTKK